jgi:hypothetical protein
MSAFFQQLGLLWQSILSVWSWAWWILLPVIAGIIFAELWEQHKRAMFHQSITWKVLELKVPQNILKTPKAMEQIFSAAYLEGEKHWMSFEMVGRAGASHFYLRIPSQFRNMMESAVYAQYPDAEITEVDDYVKQMPKVMPNQEFDLYGVEQGLAKDAWLPVRTYANFEDSVEERRIDTIALLMESMAKLKDNEQMWIQLVVKPADEKWKKAAEAAVNKLLGIEDAKKGAGIFSGFGLGVSLQDVIASPFRHPSENVPPKKEEKPSNKTEHPNKKEQVEGIRQKTGKLAFEATVRAMYIDRREALGKDNLSSITAYFRQFATQNLNAFKPEPTRSTTGKVKGFFKKWQLALRKRDFYAAYAHARPTAGIKCILNTEELATVYHFPIATVGTTELQKVGSRKGGPPATLPLVGE